MTDDDARAVLKGDGGAWIRWDEKEDRPDWWNDSITIDGDLSEQEMLAILHFKPKEPK